MVERDDGTLHGFGGGCAPCREVLPSSVLRVVRSREVGTCNFKRLKLVDACRSLSLLVVTCREMGTVTVTVIVSRGVHMQVRVVRSREIGTCIVSLQCNETKVSRCVS